MNHSMACAFNGLEGFLYYVFSCLGKYLYGHILGDHIIVYKCSYEVVLCFGCGREAYLDLLEAYVHQHLEEFQLLLKAHRLNKCLVAIP